MIETNLKTIRNNIYQAATKGGYDPEKVKLVAVTKYVSAEAVTKANEAGIKDFGENRVQEALPKISSLPSDLRWHFIGHLQSNKVKDVIPNFYMIHSLDRLSLARELEKGCRQLDSKMPVLVQVNTSGEKSKHGLDPEELGDFIDEVRKYQGFYIKGLMTMAPYVENAEEARPCFAKLRKLRDQVKDIPGVDMEYLSMGMTNDYHVAVEEGANMVRIGSAVFDE